MRKINKKLIVSDFDGTLLNSSHTISEKVKKAINEYVANGGIFAVCTGRMLKSILPRNSPVSFGVKLREIRMKYSKSSISM